MIAFMHVGPKAAIRIKVGLGLESVVWLCLAFGIILQLVLVSGLYKRLFVATVRQLKHVIIYTGRPTQ